MGDIPNISIFNNKMVESKQNIMNLSQMEKIFYPNSLNTSHQSCYMSFNELSTRFDDNKTKPSHYINREGENNSTKLNSINQQRILIENDANSSQPELYKLSNFEENKLSVPDENQKCLRISIKSVPKIAKNENSGSPHLQFSNPSNSFATRCDVVYKTLLRDCRKYFTDVLQMKSMRKSKKLSNIGRVLDEFVRNRFEQYNEDSIHQLKFYLGWLVYPKEMISSKIGLVDENNELLRGAEKNAQIKRIRDLHTFLYNFSMQRWEEFFEITPLALLFKEYLKSIEERVLVSSSMSRNRVAYDIALDLVDAKINHTIQNLI